ncbi:hypothetical protein GTA08_BOTSDO05505 [Botryosphaeria dothidea]|uniref:Uncharacterized protein n=1 Tax=Botryosphaeria dothidea TaxID=55169 RepID=A0A8H4ISJ6_9PEZI|nr:hypothetical protein GTA08_BOTSDO05505 [Botryosphaeria dothidea]
MSDRVSRIFPDEEQRKKNVFDSGFYTVLLTYADTDTVGETRKKTVEEVVARAVQDMNDAHSAVNPASGLFRRTVRSISSSMSSLFSKTDRKPAEYPEPECLCTSSPKGNRDCRFYEHALRKWRSTSEFS